MLSESRVVWSNGSWERRDYATIMSGRVVRYTRGQDRPGQSEVSASRNMICVDDAAGSPEQFSALLDILARAWRQHEHLKKAHANNPLPEIEKGEEVAE